MGKDGILVSKYLYCNVLYNVCIGMQPSYKALKSRWHYSGQTWKILSSKGEPTPSPLTGGSERREAEEPVNPNFRPQSFNQPFPRQPLYPQGSMPYRGPGDQFAPGQERMPGRDPWFNERQHPMGMGVPPLKRPTPPLQQERGMLLYFIGCLYFVLCSAFVVVYMLQ